MPSNLLNWICLLHVLIHILRRGFTSSGLAFIVSILNPVLVTVLIPVLVTIPFCTLLLLLLDNQW